jgi:lambda repressor-like predicted transcriptional regulator
MPKEIQPREAIESWLAKTGKTMLHLSVEAGIHSNTLYRHRAENTWPGQARTREGLRRALGLDGASAIHRGQSTDSNGKGSGR